MGKSSSLVDTANILFNEYNHRQFLFHDVEFDGKKYNVHLNRKTPLGYGGGFSMQPLAWEDLIARKEDGWEVGTIAQYQALLSWTSQHIGKLVYHSDWQEIPFILAVETTGRHAQCATSSWIQNDDGKIMVYHGFGDDSQAVELPLFPKSNGHPLWYQNDDVLGALFNRTDGHEMTREWTSVFEGSIAHGKYAGNFHFGPAEIEPGVRYPITIGKKICGWMPGYVVEEKIFHDLKHPPFLVRFEPLEKSSPDVD